MSDTYPIGRTYEMVEAQDEEAMREVVKNVERRLEEIDVRLAAIEARATALESRVTALGG